MAIETSMYAAAQGNSLADMLRLFSYPSYPGYTSSNPLLSALGAGTAAAVSGRPTTPVHSAAVAAAGGALPVSIRSNNPGAMWPGQVAGQYGSKTHWDLPQGQKIAVFDDPVSGAAAHFDLLAKNYSGLKLADAVKKWSGGSRRPYFAVAFSRWFVRSCVQPWAAFCRP